MATEKKKNTFRAPHDIVHKGRVIKRGELISSKYRKSFANANSTNGVDKNAARKTDSAAGIDAAAPNFGRFPMPHIQTFQGLITSAAHTYRNPDEAIKHCRENALKMRRDCFVMECIEARQRGVAMLGWHIEPEDSRDPAQKEIADLITGIMNQIPRFTEMRRSLLEAVWAGRHAVQTSYGQVKRLGKKYWGIKNWRPIHGDKLAFRYDDGTGEFDEDQIGIRVTGAHMKDDVLQGKRHLESTEWGLAYFLEPWERDLIVVHKHMIEDAAFEDYISSGSIHGVGIRSRIYWTWLQMAECMAFLLEYIERTGQGIWIYYYPSGNEVARQEVEETAEKSSRSNVILMPRMSGDAVSDPFGIERIDPSPQGAENLKTVIHEFFGHRIKRYVLGQTLSTESDAAGMGSGLADLHYNSYLEIIKYDATNLEETITQEIVRQIKEKNFPEWADYHFRFKIDTESAEKEKKLASFRQAYDMGARIPESAVMDAIGIGAPQDGDVVLQNPTIRQQERLWQQQMQQDGMGGMGGGMGGMPPGTDPNGGMPPGGGFGGPGGGPATGPNGEDLNDLFGPLVNVAQGSGTQFQQENAPVKYAKTGESKPATTTPDTGTPTTKEQGNSNPNPAPAGAAPAGASAPPGSNAPSAGGGAAAAAPPSLPKPPVLPGANERGAGAGGGPAGTNDAPGGTAEIGAAAKPANQAQASNTAKNPEQGAPPSNNKSGDGTAPTPAPNQGQAQGQGQPQTQNQLQNPSQAAQGNNQQAGQQAPAAQQTPPGGQQSQPAEPPVVWQQPEFKQQQPQRQKFVTQHFQQLTKTNAMPKSVGGMFRAMMASPNFSSNAEYSTHDFAPEQAGAIHQELAAQTGREYGGGYVCDLSATHGAGAIGFSSPAGAMVLTPPTQPGGKWLTHYSANTGVVQRAMSGEPALPMAMSAEPGAAPGQQTAPYAMADTSKPPVLATPAQMKGRNEPFETQTAGDRAFDAITNAGEKVQTGLKTAAAKTVPAAVQGATTAATAIAKLAGAAVSGLAGAASGKGSKAKGGGRNLDQEIGDLMNQGEEPATPEPSQEEVIDPKAIRQKHAAMLAEWRKKSDAGELDRKGNADYRSKLSALKAQLEHAQGIAGEQSSKEAAAAPKPKTAKELRQEKLDKEREETRTKKDAEAAEKKAKAEAAEQEKKSKLTAAEQEKKAKADAIEQEKRSKAEAAENEKKTKAEAKEKEKSARQRMLDQKAELERLGKESDETFRRTGKTLEGKPFHQLTRDEFVSETGLPALEHKQWVIDAIERSDDIPESVRKEYHELETRVKTKKEREQTKAELDKLRLEKAKQPTAAERREQQKIDAELKPHREYLKNYGGMSDEDIKKLSPEDTIAKRKESEASNKAKADEEAAASKNKARDELNKAETEAKAKREQAIAGLPPEVKAAFDGDAPFAEFFDKEQKFEDSDPRQGRSRAANKERILSALAEYAKADPSADTEKLKGILEAAGRLRQGNDSMLALVKHEIGQRMRRMELDKKSREISASYEGLDTPSLDPDGIIDKFAKDNGVSTKKLRSAIQEVRKTAAGKRPDRHDKETLARALKLIKDQSKPLENVKESDDFWDSFGGQPGSDTPPEAFQPGPAEREPGADEEEEEPVSKKKSERADEPLPFRKSLDSAARIKLLRENRPDLFAI